MTPRPLPIAVAGLIAISIVVGDRDRPRRRGPRRRHVLRGVRRDRGLPHRPAPAEPASGGSWSWPAGACCRAASTSTVPPETLQSGVLTTARGRPRLVQRLRLEPRLHRVPRHHAGLPDVGACRTVAVGGRAGSLLGLACLLDRAPVPGSDDQRHAASDRARRGRARIPSRWHRMPRSGTSSRRRPRCSS